MKRKIACLATTLLWLMLFGTVAWFPITGALAATNNWKMPRMADYEKEPPFISTSVVPNIMIILDTSSSMEYSAYGSDSNGNILSADSFNGKPMPTVQAFPVEYTADNRMENLTTGVVWWDSLSDGQWDGLDIGTDLVGLRFQQVVIPKGAVIDQARILFAAQRSSDDTDCNVTITVEDSTNAARIEANVHNLSGRTTIGQSVNWYIDTAWEQDTDGYASADVSSLIQALVDKDDWNEDHGINILFLIRPAAGNTGLREAESLREFSESVEPVLKIKLVDGPIEDPETYYGYFNPDWFYIYDAAADEFQVAYKKVGEDAYDKWADRWTVLEKDDLESEEKAIFMDRDALLNRHLWDGNWLNWLSMRRLDILRKVLFGGNTNGSGTPGESGRDGGGNQLLYGIDTSRSYTKSFETDRAGGPPFDQNLNYRIRNQNIEVRNGEYTIDSFKIRVRKNINYEPDAFAYYDNGDNLAGILQRVGNRANWGNIWFWDNNSDSGPDGGYVENPIGADIASLVADLEIKKPASAPDYSYTPLAETLYVAMQYFSQASTVAGYRMYGPGTDVTKGGQGDPYYYLDDSTETPKYRPVSCVESFVLLLTDGLSTRDGNVPSGIRDYDKTDDETEYDYDYGGTDYLNDVALYAHTVDLRPDEEKLSGDQNITLYAVYAFGGDEGDEEAQSLLRRAAKNGGFVDAARKNGSDEKTPPNKLPDGADDYNNSEYDIEAPIGVPDNYFEASNGYELEKQIRNAVDRIVKTASSGTSASVVSNSRSGEGAVYQSIFFPEKDGAGDVSVQWFGQLNALFMDAYGNLREDTDSNHTLNMKEDLIVAFETDDDDNPVTNRYKDSDGNGVRDPGPPESVITGQSLDKIQYLWSSNDWLNKLVDPVTQRENYKTFGQSVEAGRRFITTFVDFNGNLVPDAGETMPFVDGDPDWETLISPENYYAYIHTTDQPFSSGAVDAADLAHFKEKMIAQTRRVIKFVRGEDQAEATVGTGEAAETLDAFRRRQLDIDNDRTLETMRLGDIVYSTPTVVSKPSENFDLIYRDLSYLPFVRRHLNRRQVIYVGANDGMLHAFNGGFYDQADRAFLTQPLDDDGNPKAAIADYPLGAELWAYVPYNLLPHLYWLTQTDYGHVYYMDLPPRVFDAKVYDSETHGPDDKVYPNGWATILVAGMRFGGGRIAADIDKSDGPYNAAKDKVLNSAYVIMDITNPEEPPKLLAEVSFPDLGFTTCHPGVVPNRERGTDKNEWYLLFGSGPTSPSASGEGDVGPNNTALMDGTSAQQGRLYALDLVTLVQEHKVVMRTGSLVSDRTDYPAEGTPPDTYALQVFDEEKSSVSKPIAVDWDLDFKTDAAYFGTSFGDNTMGWGGKLRRVVISDGVGGTSNWNANSTMLDLTLEQIDDDHLNGQPIMSAATAGVDDHDRRWIFFGTGRYMSIYDKLNGDKQSVYGLKEPLGDDNITFSYDEVAFDSLRDVSDEKIYDNDYYPFRELKSEIAAKSVGGWRMNFIDKGERLLAQPVLAGEILTFTSYVPAETVEDPGNPDNDYIDICSIAGDSWLYALHYLTGTAYYKSIIGLDYQSMNADEVPEVKKRTKLGDGLASSPNIQIGRGSGVRTFSQSGQGRIETREEKVAGQVKSSRGYWLPDLEECPE